MPHVRNLTDYCCEDCGEPVCEECAVPYDQFTQIDYTLCQCCHDGNMSRRQLEAYREEDLQAESKAKKDARNKAARERYWRPENVAKRKAAREERKRLKREQAIRNFQETMRIVSEVFPSN